MVFQLIPYSSVFFFLAHITLLWTDSGSYWCLYTLYSLYGFVFDWILLDWLWTNVFVSGPLQWPLTLRWIWCASFTPLPSPARPHQQQQPEVSVIRPKPHTHRRHTYQAQFRLTLLWLSLGCFLFIIIILTNSMPPLLPPLCFCFLFFLVLPPTPICRVLNGQFRGISLSFVK